VLAIHIDEAILDAENNIDPLKLDLVSRLGGSWYGKTTKDSLFKINKPAGEIGMGIDQLPEHIRNSTILAGNDLAILAERTEVPAKDHAETNEEQTEEEKHTLAKGLLAEGKTDLAWQALL
jgi:hypothetical protein